jgi:hypothetical protein
MLRRLWRCLDTEYCEVRILLFNYGDVSTGVDDDGSF